MALRGAVEIEAYTIEKKLVLRQVFPLHEWYEHSHPIIDSDDERALLHVSMVQGKQYDDDGSLEQFWSSSYSERGNILEMHIWRKDGSDEQLRFQS